jgi:hypothetical protein
MDRIKKEWFIKLLYMCRKNNWFRKQAKKKEAYYLELNEEELNEKLKSLLSEQEKQMKEQLEEYGKIYIIVDKNIKNAIYVPHGGPHWPESGHWDMSNMFKGMYGIELQSIKDLKNIKRIMLEKSIEYLKTDYGVFGNINEFRFGFNGHESFTSAIAESYIYNYFIKKEQYPVIPEEEMIYNFIVNGERILVKTNAIKIENDFSEYDWYENSCWKKNREIDTNEWDFLYFVPIKWDGKKYHLKEKYKISYKEFHGNKKYLDAIRKKPEWFVPVDFDMYLDWLCKFRISEMIDNG